jgi:hypothetical protein
MPQITLWFVRETAAARLYTKVPPERNPQADDHVWIPRSVVEHTSKTGNTHIVTLPDWVVEQKKL